MPDVDDVRDGKNYHLGVPMQVAEAVMRLLQQACEEIGADADLTMFDPATVIDKADYGDPAKYSEGFRYVLVAGVPIVANGELQGGVAPGRPVRGPIK